MAKCIRTLQCHFIAITLLLLVTVACQQKKAQDIYFISQRDYNAAFLFNSAGKIIYSWENPELEAQTRRGWHNAKITKDGDILAINKGRSIFKFDKNSKKVFKLSGGFHHDFVLDREENFYAIKRKIEEVPAQGRSLVILNDYISIHDKSGKQLDEIAIFPIVKDLIPVNLFEAIINNPEALPKPDTERDLFHANSIDLYYQKNDTSAVKLNCSDKSYLVSLRTLSLVIIVDSKSKQLCWTSQGLDIKNQHHASFTKNNLMTIFNNRDKKKGSEVLLINPRTKKIIQSVSGRGEQRFYTKSGGSVQLLNNGGFLVGITGNGDILHFDKSGTQIFKRTNNFRNKDEADKFFRVSLIEDLAKYPFIGEILR